MPPPLHRDTIRFIRYTNTTNYKLFSAPIIAIATEDHEKCAAGLSLGHPQIKA
jgi:hypothetical protein